MSDGLPRAYLRSGLLVLLAGGQAHGYDLLEQARGLGISVHDPGSLYRILRSMERDGEVRSWWEPSDAGPSRRTYVLTGAGQVALVEVASSLRTTISRLQRLAEAAEAQVPVTQRAVTQRAATQDLASR